MPVIVHAAKKLKQIAKEGHDRIMNFLFQYVMTGINESQLFELQKNVAALDPYDANELLLMDLLFRKIVIVRRNKYICFLKYKSVKNEIIQMTESQYHQALLNEEQVRKARNPLQKIIESLGFSKPRLLKDETMMEFLYAQEKLIADLKKKSRVFHLNYRFTEQFCLEDEVKKLKQKYRLIEQEQARDHNLVSSCADNLEVEVQKHLLASSKQKIVSEI